MVVKEFQKKNIKIFRGKPLIERVINEALSSNLFEKLIVSTDSKEIAKVSLDAGAEVPFLRPNELADDYASTSEVIIHAINWYNQKGIIFSSVCCNCIQFLYPKSLLFG